MVEPFEPTQSAGCRVDGQAAVALRAQRLCDQHFGDHPHFPGYGCPYVERGGPLPLASKQGKVRITASERAVLQRRQTGGIEVQEPKVARQKFRITR